MEKRNFKKKTMKKKHWKDITLIRDIRINTFPLFLKFIYLFIVIYTGKNKKKKNL